MAEAAGDTDRAVPVVPDGRSLTLRLERIPTASRTAREFLRTSLGDLDTETLDTVLLVATELVTNAVRHADGPIDLDVACGARRVVVAVLDNEPRLPLLREQDVLRADGRGIALVSMVSTDWGTVRHGDGKTVWAAVDRPQAPADRVDHG